MGSMDCRLEFFSVSDRLYTPELKQNNVSTQSPTDVKFPTYTFPMHDTNQMDSKDYLTLMGEYSPDGRYPIVEPNSLAEFVGMPVGYVNLNNQSDYTISMNRALGYIDIVRNYYANLQVPRIPTARVLAPGGIGGDVYNQDYLLSDLDSVIANPSVFLQTFGNYAFFKRNNLLFCRTQKPTLLETWLNKSQYDAGAGSVSVQVTDNEVILTDVRFGSHVLQYMERSLAGGTRYDDWLGAQFDVKVQKNLLIPQYLGSASFKFTVDDIFQTSQTTEGDNGSPLGALAGKGTAGNKFSRRTFRFEENGTFVAIFSIRPNPDYFLGVDPMLEKLQLSDKYAPALDRSGFQSLPASWLNFLPTWINDSAGGNLSMAHAWSNETDPSKVAVGYQPAWSEYRTGFSRLHGNLTGFQRYWTWARKYDLFTARHETDAELNTLVTDQTSVANLVNLMFIGHTLSPYVLPWLYNDCFADTSFDAENFVYQVALDIKCSRQISKLTMPSFFM